MDTTDMWRTLKEREAVERFGFCPVANSRVVFVPAWDKDFIYFSRKVLNTYQDNLKTTAKKWCNYEYIHKTTRANIIAQRRFRASDISVWRTY
jgi:hypothetical protein